MKYALLAGGGYLLYRYLTTPAAVGSAPTTGTQTVTLADLVNAIKSGASGTSQSSGAGAAGAASGGGAPASPAGPTVGTKSLTADDLGIQRSKILAAASAAGSIPQPPFDANGMLTASQWNYFYNSVYASDPSAVAWYLDDDGKPMSIDSYFNLRKAKGFSGVGRSVLLPVMVGRDGSGRRYVARPGLGRVYLGR